MPDLSRPRRMLMALPALALGLSFVLLLTQVVPALAHSPVRGKSRLALPALQQISADPFTDTVSQHQTEVEPDTFAWGSTIVAAFQVGRNYNGGSSDIGWATSTDNGATWMHGFLPGITTLEGNGAYDRVSDPSVAYDARHNVWLILALPIKNASFLNAPAILVSRSTDGGQTWGNPVTVSAGGDLDKDWLVCDTTASSPYYGHCYAEWDAPSSNNLVQMSTSADGGLTWSAPQTSANRAGVIGGQPLVQPNGTVVVPTGNADDSQILAFTSTNGGGSWSKTVLVAHIALHTSAGNLRTDALPSADVDAAGRIYVVWQDCRYVPGCAFNDLVISASNDGLKWTLPARIPIDGLVSTADHFIPGLGIDHATAGGVAHLGLTYYYYPQPQCSAATCQLNVGFVSSVNGGGTWSAATQLAGPMNLSWLPDTAGGPMVGDYISTSIGSDGLAHTVFPVASAPTGTTFNQAMVAPVAGLTIMGGPGYPPGTGMPVAIMPTGTTAPTQRERTLPTQR